MDWAKRAVKEGLVEKRHLGRMVVLFGSAMLNGSLETPWGEKHRKTRKGKKA
jgi:hypothetical protein